MGFISMRSLPLPDKLKSKVYTCVGILTMMATLLWIWWPSDNCWTPETSKYQTVVTLDKTDWLNWLRVHTEEMGSILHDGLTSYSIILYAAIYLTEGPILELGRYSF